MKIFNLAIFYKFKLITNKSALYRAIFYAFIFQYIIYVHMFVKHLGAIFN